MIKGDVDMALVADAIKTLEQEPCEDCISRQAVLEGKVIHQSCDGVEIINSYAVPVEYIEQLPSIQPKTGHWIVQLSNEEQGERPFIWWKCSNCGQVIFSETTHDRLEYHAFCGRCGAKMVEPQESEG